MCDKNHDFFEGQFTDFLSFVTVWLELFPFIIKVFERFKRLFADNQELRSFRGIIEAVKLIKPLFSGVLKGSVSRGILRLLEYKKI